MIKNSKILVLLLGFAFVLVLTGMAQQQKSEETVTCPVSGEVIEANETLEDHPEYVNQSPYDKGWIVKMTFNSVSELDDLMDSQAYHEFIKSEGALE